MSQDEKIKELEWKIEKLNEAVRSLNFILSEVYSKCNFENDYGYNWEYKRWIEDVENL